MNQRLKKFLEKTVREGASDLHLTVDAPPTLRVSGELVPLSGSNPLAEEDVQELIFAMVDDEQKEQLLINKEVDFAFSYTGDGVEKGARFRVNAFHTRGNLAAALRRIPLRVPSIDELNLPSFFHTLTELPQGFVIFTGPAGCGKSTSIASIIDEISRSRAAHIITVEDPVEYVFPHRQALIAQREVGRDTLSWNVGLRNVLREDPDVIFVGEMRDTATISSAVTMAETGHLVFSTLHTNSASQTVDRIIDAFPDERQDQIASQLAASLEAVIAQRLIPSIEGGLVPVCEILLVTPAVRNLIREGERHQLDNVITTSSEQGMVSLERALARLVREGVVERDVARRVALRPQEFSRLLH
ncbi:MAG: type IV pilus twitching motility protein PilT [Patescibacteria group bacterium]